MNKLHGNGKYPAFGLKILKTDFILGQITFFHLGCLFLTCIFQDERAIIGFPE
jgi:hypothetical protein